NKVRDAFDQLRFVDLIRNLGKDNRRAIALLVGLDHRTGTHQDGPAAGGIRLHDTRAAHDVAGGWKIRSGNQVQQGLDLVVPGDDFVAVLEMRVLNEPDAAVDDLTQIV